MSSVAGWISWFASPETLFGGQQHDLSTNISTKRCLITYLSIQTRLRQCFMRPCSLLYLLRSSPLVRRNCLGKRYHVIKYALHPEPCYLRHFSIKPLSQTRGHIMQSTYSPESFLREPITATERLTAQTNSLDLQPPAADASVGIKLLSFDPHFSEYELFGSLLERLQRCRRRLVRYAAETLSGSRCVLSFQHGAMN